MEEYLIPAANLLVTNETRVFLATKHVLILLLNSLSFFLNKAILTLKTKHYCFLSLIKVKKFSWVKLFNNNLLVNKIKNFYFKYKIVMEFFFEVNNLIIHESIRQFQAHTNDTIKYLDYIYCGIAILLILFN